MKLESEAPGLSRELVELYRADQARQSEVDRAYRRFLRKAEPRAYLPRAGRWLIGGLVLGLGVSYAASRAPWSSPVESAPQSASVSTAKPSSIRSPGVPFGEPFGATKGSSEAAGAGRQTENSAAFGSLPQTGPKPAHAARYSAPSVPAMSSAAPFTEQAVDLPQREAGAWSKVAKALRDKDARTAEVELQQLERSSALGERDAARLARAQILVGSGRSREAAALLQDLATHAQSPLVRAKAAALLREITKAH